MLWLKNGLLVKGTDGRLINCATCPCLCVCEDKASITVTFSGVTIVPQGSCSRDSFSVDGYQTGFPDINGAHTLNVTTFPVFQKTIPVTASWTAYSSTDGSCSGSVINSGTETSIIIKAQIFCVNPPLVEVVVVGSNNSPGFHSEGTPPWSHQLEINSDCTASFNNSLQDFVHVLGFWAYGGAATIS